MTSKTKVSSLKWAIDELSKQRVDLNSKLKIAQKRDETNSLIEEVFAQKNALEQRISALQDGLRVSSELVDISSTDLESEMSKIDEKLDIAKERLNAIEQEEYLEELGRSLNRSQGGEIEAPSINENMPVPNTSLLDDLDLSSTTEEMSSHLQTASQSSLKKISDFKSSSSTVTSNEPVMKPISNRIENQESEADGKPGTILAETSKKSHPTFSLEETAENLGVEPQFLAEKGLDAILRMIARNQGKLTFPLEVEQID